MIISEDKITEENVLKLAEQLKEMIFNPKNDDDFYWNYVREFKTDKVLFRMVYLSGIKISKYLSNPGLLTFLFANKNNEYCDLFCETLYKYGLKIVSKDFLIYKRPSKDDFDNFIEENYTMYVY